jgi:hypothetical protein
LKYALDEIGLTQDKTIAIAINPEIILGFKLFSFPFSHDTLYIRKKQAH